MSFKIVLLLNAIDNFSERDFSLKSFCSKKTQALCFLSSQAFSFWWLSKELGRGIKKDGLPDAIISAIVEPPDRAIIKSDFSNIL